MTTSKVRAWPQIVLTGFMGAGKTTIGRALAAQLEAPLFDSDALIEDASGTRIGDLFGQLGEPKFRDLEHRCITAVAGLPGTILALGGGAIVCEATRASLRNCYIVYLEISPTTSLRRIGDPSSRPLANTGELTQLLEAREPIYRSVAQLILPEQDEPPEATLSRLLSALPPVYHPA